MKTFKKISLISFMLISLSIAKGQGTLLVANKNEHNVSVIDLTSGKEVSKISVGHGPHEIAVSPSGKLAAVANYGNKQVISNSLTIIDVAKREKVKEISMGEYQRPHGMEFMNDDEVLVTCETKQVLLKVNIQSGAVSEVAKTNQLVSHMVAYSNTDKKAYVANIASGTVSMIDVPGNSLLKQLEFKKGIEGVAVSPDGKEVWVANRDDSTVTAMNTKTFEKSAPMPAHQVAYRIKFLPDGKHVMVSNGMSGNMSVYHAAKKSFIKDINLVDKSRPNTQDQPNMPVPVGMAVSTDSKYVFVSMAGYGQVAVISTKSWSVVKVIQTGNGPDGIYYSPI